MDRLLSSVRKYEISPFYLLLFSHEKTFSLFLLRFRQSHTSVINISNKKNNYLLEVTNTLSADKYTH